MPGVRLSKTAPLIALTTGCFFFVCVSIAHGMPGCSGRLFPARKDVKMTGENLRVGLNVVNAATTLDPQLVLSTVDAHLSRNLYSRLISIDDEGQISGDLASDFSWDGRSYTFTLRPLRTIDGWEIGAEDVYFSLLRIVRNGKATHGNLREFLCPDFDPSRSTACPGLRLEKGQLVLTPSDPTKGTFLMLLLGSVDMSILPKRALDLESAHWNVIDHRNTTGVYYLSQAGADGAATWEVNPHHYRYDASLFPKIEIAPTKTGPDSARAFAAGQVDFLPTSAGVKKSDLATFGDSLEIHESLPIQLIPAAFTLRGHRLSKEDRLIIGAHLKAAIAKRKNPDNGVETSQIFPQQSDGMLDIADVNAYEKLLASKLTSRPSRTIDIAVGASLYDDLAEALAQIPWARVERVTQLPHSRPLNEQPDVTILPGDTSFYESLTMIHYYFTMGAFGNYEAGVRWIDDYMKIGDKTTRLARLRELHRALLMNGDVVPLYISKYYAVARPPVRMAISKFFAGTPMWKVYRD